MASKYTIRCRMADHCSTYHAVAWDYANRVHGGPTMIANATGATRAEALRALRVLLAAL